MIKIKSKSQLAIALTGINLFVNPKVELEQYPTDSEIAAEILWNMSMRGEIENRKILDLGSGTGVLGIGSLLLGAGEVIMIDVDKDALSIAKKNLIAVKKEFRIKKAVFIESRIEDLSPDYLKGIDCVVQNPPFGIKKKHADRSFLEKAMQVSENIYSFHMPESKEFIERPMEYQLYNSLKNDRTGTET